MDKFWLTEYDGADGIFAGPIIVMDTHAAAQAVMQTCLLGPGGERLRLVGELVQRIHVSNEATGLSRERAM